MAYYGPRIEELKQERAELRGAKAVLVGQLEKHADPFMRDQHKAMTVLIEVALINERLFEIADELERLDN